MPTCTQAKETRTQACASGETGIITEERTVNTGNTCGTTGSWAVVSNTCAVQPEGLTLYGEQAYDCRPAGSTGVIRSTGVCNVKGSTRYRLSSNTKEGGTMHNTSIANTDYSATNYASLSYVCAKNGYQYYQGYKYAGDDWDQANYKFWNMPAGNADTGPRNAAYMVPSSWIHMSSHKGCSSCQTPSEVYCTRSATYTGCDAQVKTISTGMGGSDTENLPAAPFGKTIIGSVDVTRRCGNGEELINRMKYTCRPGGWAESGMAGSTVCPSGAPR